MDENQQKGAAQQRVCCAAVASVAGYGVHRPEPDDDSVDLVVRRARGALGSYRSPRLDVQVKCTARDCMTEEAVRYPLKTKNYDDLRGEGLFSCLESWWS